MPPEYGQNNVSFVEEQQLRRRTSYRVAALAGMIKFLVDRGIARDGAQANLILLGVAVGAAIVAIGAWVWGGGFGDRPYTPPDQIVEVAGPGNQEVIQTNDVPLPGAARRPAEPSSEEDTFDPSLYRRVQ